MCRLRLDHLCQLALLVALAGCAPADPLSIEDRAGIGASMAMAVIDPRAEPEPPPAPKPAPGAVCPECEGRGKVSRDGRVFTQCLPCKGTGKVQAQASSSAPCPPGKVCPPPPLVPIPQGARR